MTTQWTKYPLKDYPLTLIDFKGWLRGKPGKEMVGEFRDCTVCPIAVVLREKLHIRDSNDEDERAIHVYGGTTYIRDGMYENPQWVRDFIGKLDTTPKSALGYVSAEKALEIVNNLYICTVCNQYNSEGTNCGKKDNCPW